MTDEYIDGLHLWGDDGGVYFVWPRASADGTTPTTSGAEHRLSAQDSAAQGTVVGREDVISRPAAPCLHHRTGDVFDKVVAFRDRLRRPP